MEDAIPNGCIFKDHTGNAFFFWMYKGKVPDGSQAISFGTSFDEHLKELTTKQVQFVHAIVTPIKGIDATKLKFDTYDDFKKVDFHISFRERIPLTRRDGSLITIMDISYEGSEILIELIHKHMEKEYGENLCSG